MPAQPCYLKPTEFNSAAAAWTDAVSKEESLLPFFSNSVRKPDEGPILKLQYVTFSVDDMISLVSTVGVRYIRAQFVLLPSTVGGIRFTVVLYALDSQKGRISAYYAGSAGPIVPAPIPASPSGPATNGELPVDLVQAWLLAWQNLADVSPDIFGTNYGPLQGYIFNLEDFIDPLFPNHLTTGYELRVYMGLHSYQITSGNEVQPDTTAGLIISVQPTHTARLPVNFRTNKATLLKLGSDENGDAADNGFYDLSNPNPPGVGASTN